MALPILNLLSFGIKTAANIYQTKKETKELEAIAEKKHVERIIKGEVEYKKAVIASNDNGWKDEFVLVLISIPILLLGYSVFSNDPDIQVKLDLFFANFNNLPFWYQGLFIGVVGSIYGLKGVDLMKKR
ncbi:hypothetical protein P109_gp47 [Pelagibacter phage HTVC109P]|nr:hypothetical protein P109_gp47 [Pelagibacter phage HTVC109P]